MNILEPGFVIRETYEVERFLGEGAFAEVYRVNHRFMGRQAMKVFKLPGTTLEDLEEGMGEARMLSKLRHRNLMEVFDANVLEVSGQRYGYFTMTYMPGGTLDRYWKSFGSNLMPVAQVVEIVQQLCRGLSMAHSTNPPIVHRDIKPQNILVSLTEDGVHVRLSDFGLAKAVNPLTLLVSSRGTLGFKPPEAFRNQDSCSADIWAIGTTMHLLLTDNLPFPMLGRRDMDDAHRFLRPMAPPSSYNVGVDRALESVIYRCLAADPQDRYPNAMELLRDLDRWTPGFQGGPSTLSEYASGKTAMGDKSGHDLKAEASACVEEALAIARDPLKLQVAADLLEEALSKDPALRDRFADHLGMWRKGIMHVSTASFPARRGVEPKIKS